MDFSINEDQEALRDLVRMILTECAPPERIREVESPGARLARALWQELAAANLMGIATAEAFGGTGLGALELGIRLEEGGRAVAPVPVLETLVLGALPLATFGSPEQRQAWLPGVCRGEVILTGAFAGDAIEVAPKDGGWQLTGELPMVPAATVADHILVVVGSGRSAGGYWVDGSAAEVGIAPVLTTDQQARAHVTLRGAAAERLGESALELGAWLRRRATLGICAQQIGVCERALELTASYVSERHQFDRPVGSFQAVHTRAADAYIDLQAMRLTYWRALHVLEHEGDGAAADELIVIAKYWCAEGGARVTAAAQHLHGGIGVDVDYPLHRHYLWGRQLGLQLGGGAEQLAALGAMQVAPAAG